MVMTITSRLHGTDACSDMALPKILIAWRFAHCLRSDPSIRGAAHAGIARAFSQVSPRWREPWATSPII